MGRIYQRRKGGPYSAYWTDLRGIHHRQALGTHDAAVARARLRDLELAATNPAAYGRTSLSEAITALLDVVEHGNASATWKFYAQKGRHLVRVFGDVGLSTIDRETCLLYVKQRRLERASPHTIHKELTCLRRAFVEAENRGLWTGDVRKVIPAIKVDYKPRETHLDEHQSNQLLQRVAPNRRLWVMLAMYGGLCLGEIERLRWEHVDFVAGTMRVPGTKRKDRHRVIPVVPELLYAMEPVRQKTGPVVDRWRNVIRGLAVACAKAKIPRVTPNDLRRTFASWLKSRGADSALVARLLGHSSTKMVDLVYGKLSMGSLTAAVESLLPVPDRCVTGVQDVVAFGDTNETDGPFSDPSQRREVERFRVPRDGVEPPTRGFSVPSDTSKVRRLGRR